MMKYILVWLLATAILISAPAANAQQPGKVFRIGFLDNSTASGSAVLVDALRQELSKLGWIEGKKNLALAGFSARTLGRKNHQLTGRYDDPAERAGAGGSGDQITANSQQNAAGGKYRNAKS